MHVDVPVTTYFFIFPGTFQSCSSVSFMEDVLTFVPVVGGLLLSLCIPLQSNKCYPSVVSEKMVMRLQDT
jgi:hypothetical protein